MIRRKAIKFAADVMTKTGSLKILDRWNRGRGGVILVFHEIPGDVLSSHLERVAESYTFVCLDEFVKRLAENKSTVGLAAITFDDGIGVVTESAAALAVSRGWPMTFYLPTRYLDTGEPYWFLELDFLLERAPSRTLSLDGQIFSLNSPDSILQTSKILRKRFKSLVSAEAVDALLRAIRRSLFGSEERPPALPFPAPIPWDRVRQLAAHDEVSFESHTITHLATSRLNEKQLEVEMEGSRARIEEFTGRPVNHFCYPYGSPDEVGTTAPHTVRKLFRSGTTTSRGRCSSGVDLAVLPRVPLDEGDSAEVAALKVGSAR